MKYVYTAWYNAVQRPVRAVKVAESSAVRFSWRQLRVQYGERALRRKKLRATFEHTWTFKPNTNFQTKYKLSKSIRLYAFMSYFCNIWIAPVSNQTSFVCHMLFCNMQMVVARIFRNYQKVFSRLYQLFYGANIDSTCYYPITSLSCHVMQSC